MNAPLFSVVVPSFNSGPKLADTLTSALAQDGNLRELIVIDGGSTDGTLERLRARGPDIRWISEPDLGIYDAMNKGLRLAYGKFLYFLGSGDRLRPGILKSVADLLPRGESRPLFVYGNVNWPSVDERYGGTFDAVHLAWQNICHQAIFYDRAIFNLLGEYDPRYRTCADHAMNIRCFGHPEIRRIHLDLVVADYEGGGASTNNDPVFDADRVCLAWRHLGARAGVRAYLQHGRSLQWARWLNYQFRQPWHTLPGRARRVWQRSFSSRLP